MLTTIQMMDKHLIERHLISLDYKQILSSLTGESIKTIHTVTVLSQVGLQVLIMATKTATDVVIGRQINRTMKKQPQPKVVKLSREYPKIEKNSQLLLKYLEKNHGRKS
jgi:hypothetical protein